MKPSIYESFLQKKEANEKQFAVLIDPDKVQPENLDVIVDLSTQAKVDYLLIGGSLVLNDNLDFTILKIKEACDIPVILFPGSTMQLSPEADAILFMSLISGRNPELLIGKQVEAAPFLHSSSLEIISTGYMLIDGGVPTSVSYMSHSIPIPANKPDIATCTALAGEMLGLKVIFMDAGSGAVQPVSERMIRQVSKKLTVPLIVGGGITTPEKAQQNVKAGADIIVIGNAIEKDPILLIEISEAIKAVSSPAKI